MMKDFELTDKFDEPEMVRITEFARHFKVCTNTIRNWMRCEKLRENRHYLRNKRVIRFFWSTKTIRQLMDDWATPPASTPRISTRKGNRVDLIFRA